MLELVVALFVLSGFTGVMVGVSRRNALKRRIRTGSFTLAHDTLVTVVGVIRQTGDLVDSPISAGRGVYVYAEAELPEPGEDLEYKKLKTIRMVPFELDTQHGVILVEGTTADISMKPTAPKSRSKDREREFMTSHKRGAEVANVATFREVVLAPGARITVYGLAKIEELPRAERGYRDSVPTQTRIVAPAKVPITIGVAADRY